MNAWVRKKTKSKVTIITCLVFLLCRPASRMVMVLLESVMTGVWHGAGQVTGSPCVTVYHAGLTGI